MAGRPLPLGTWGKIRTYITKTDDRGRPVRSRAIAKYREFNGRTVRVERLGKTPAEAENNLRIALKERSSVGSAGRELTALHRFSAAADMWWRRLERRVDEGARSPTTLETYGRVLRKHVLPAMAEVRLGEFNTPLVDSFIADVRDSVGPATAKLCRSIVSGVLGVAVRAGVLAANPVREVELIESSRTKKKPRALTAEERELWFKQLRADPFAVRKDLPDLTAFMLGTGVRIGEALAVIWSEIDLARGAVEITSTIVRVKAVGLVRKPTKSEAGERVLALPDWLVAILRRRHAMGVRLDHPVFPDSLGGFRDPNNVRRDLRTARGEGALAWITSHSFRKTTATILDGAGQSARQVADQLGHSRPSMTQDVYMARGVANTDAAAFLDAELGRLEV